MVIYSTTLQCQGERVQVKNYDKQMPLTSSVLILSNGQFGYQGGGYCVYLLSAMDSLGTKVEATVCIYSQQWTV